MRNWLPAAWRRTVVTSLPARLGLEALEAREVPASFAAGNLVVYRVGTGSAALGNTATAAFLDEYKTDGTLVQSIALPTADSGSNQTLTNSGSATSEGALSRSPDGKYLLFAGYDAATGTTGVASTASSAVARVIGRAGADGAVDTSTTTTSFSGNNIRGAGTADGSTLYAVGGTTGVVAQSFGTSGTAGTVVSSTFTNMRTVSVFDGQLYVSSGSSTLRLGSVGTGTPTTSGQTTANLSGLPTGTISPYAFYFADRSASVTGVDTLYITDDTATTGGVLKYSFDGSAWTAQTGRTGTVNSIALPSRGLTGVTNADGSVTLYGTSSAGVLYSLTDTGDYNAAFSSTNPASIATQSTNTAFRGVAFAPETLALSPATLPDGTQGSSYSQTLTASGGVSSYVFALASGSSLPAGLALSTAGVISGTPTATGTTNFTVAVTDATGARVTKQYSVTVTSNNAAPTVSASSGATTFIENDADTAVDGGLTVADDGTTLTEASVTISGGFVSAEDALVFTTQNGISGSYSNGVLTLSGSAGVSAYETALRSVKYSNASENPTPGDRTISFTATDDSNASSSAATKTLTVVAVNDAPTLSATGGTVTFIEGGSAATPFSGASASTVESGQSLRGLTLTVSGLSGGANEALVIDGSNVTLTNGNSVTTVANGFNVTVSVAGGVATVTLDKPAGVSAGTFTGIVDGITYRHDGDDPTAGDRVVTLTSVRDTGGTSDGGADTTTLSVAATVTVVPVNDAPTLTATAVGGTFTEGGSAVGLFSSTAAATVEAGQTLLALTLTVTNVSDGTAEVLVIDGSDVALTNGNSLTTADFSVSVSVTSGTATVTVSKAPPGVSASALAAAVSGLTYRNDSQAPTTGSRVVTLTSVRDNGGTANSGADTATLNISSTVTVAAVNDAPVVANVDGDSTTFLAGGSAVLLDAGGDATVTDVDSSNFDTGALTVSVTGGVATDALGIRNQGTNSGQIGVSGGTVSYEGTAIGTFAGGTGSNLVVTFNTAATPAAVQALLRNLTLLPDATASTATRTVTVGVTDGDGGGSNTSTASVAVNTVPQVLSITRNDPTATNAGTVSWTVTFSQAVSGVDLNDFALTPTGTLSVGSRSVSSSGGGAATAWVYTATSTGDGTLDLDFTDANGVTPPAGGTFDGPAYTLDRTAPTVTFGITPAAVSSSNSATFTFSGSDPTAGGVSSGVASFAYSVDGGAYSPATSPLALTGLADGSHTVRVRATDAAGNVGTPAAYTFTVDATAPTVQTFANSSSPPVVTGVAITYTVTFGEDINAGTVTASSFVNAGTAAVTFGTPTETGPNTGVFTLAVTPTTTGTIVLRVVAGGAADLAGNTLTANATDPVTVSVVNVAPTATFANGGAVSEGSSGTVSFSGAADSSPLDAAAGFRYAYDFDNDGTFEVGDGTYAGSSTAAATVPAAYLADGNGTRTVRAVVIDQGGQSREYFTTIPVTNVAPTVALSGGAGVNEGSVYTLTVGAVTDPGQDTVSQYRVNWGDGSSDTYTTGGAKTHAYADDGTYAVTVDLTDEDGTFLNRGSAASAVVANVAPTITAFNLPGGGTAGIAVGVSAAATDPAGANDPLTFSWAVTKNGSPFASGAGATFTFTPDAAGTYAVSLAVSDGDGGTAARSGLVGVVAAPLPYRPMVATAVGARVSVFDPVAGTTATLDPYPGFPGSVTVATADLNGDGFADIVTGAGPGGGPHVKVFDGKTMAEVASFYAYGEGFKGGVFVAAGGGRIATGAGAGGGPHVKTFDRLGNELSSFFAFSPSFTGGVRVAVGDLDANGVPEVVAATGPGVRAEVRVFANGSTNVATSIAPFDAFRGGAFVAVGGGRIAVGADAGGGPHVKTFTPAGRETASFYAFAQSFAGGVRVAFADDNADGTPDLLAATGPGGGPTVRAFTVSPFGLLADRPAGDPLDPRGVFVS